MIGGGADQISEGVHGCGDIENIMGHMIEEEDQIFEGANDWGTSKFFWGGKRTITL